MQIGYRMLIFGVHCFVYTEYSVRGRLLVFSKVSDNIENANHLRDISKGFLIDLQNDWW